MNPPASPRILLIQIRRFGDVVLTTPLLEDLHDAMPGARVDFLVGAAAAPLLAAHPGIAELLVLDKKRPVRMWREIRARRYDWIIDVQSNPRTAMLTRLSGAPVRVGWDVRGWGWVYTHSQSRHLRDYVVRNRQRLLELIGVPVVERHARLHLTDEERRRGEADFAAHGVEASAPRVGMLLTSGDPVKNWPPERFAEVAEALAREGVVPILFTTREDGDLSDRFASRSPDAVIVREPSLEIRRFMGMLAACDVFVSADTGPAHMATALGVPRVTVHGPSDPFLWTPPLPSVAVVRPEVEDCPGCRKGTWRAPHTCMEAIPSDAVLARVRRLLGAARTSTHRTR